MNTGKHKELTYLIPSVIIMSVVFIITYFYSANVINSDMAAELILAKELLREHKLFTKNWFYSTEVRVVYTQLISMVLFLFMRSWSMVRAVMNLICSVLMVVSYLYMVKPLGINKKTAYLSTSLLLIPFSTDFISIMQVGNSYMPHVIFCFLGMGLALRLFDEIKIKNICFYMLVMVICGVSGIRYALVLTLPLLAAALLVCEEEAYREKRTVFSKALLKDRRVRIALTGLLGYLAGYLVNGLYFGRYYFVEKYDSLAMTDFHVGDNNYNILEHLSRAITDIFRLFGYVDGVGVLSFSGIQSMAAICLVAALLYMFWIVYRGKEEEKVRFFKFFTLMVLIMNVAVFIFINSMSGVRYFILIYVFYIPLIALYFEKYSQKHYDISKAVNMLFIVCCVILCITNLRYIVVCEENDEIKEAAQFLEEKQAKFGMTTFWNGDILTELSDGDIQVVNIAENKFIYPYKWLMPARFLERDTWETVDTEYFFLLLRFTDIADMGLEGNPFAYEKLERGELVYADNGYRIFFYDRDTFIDTYAPYICGD
ncbi:MAG: hypothetical protein NC086_08100 [Alistipes sp.]|nr:hypothetical protein [Alistipes sp.]